MKKIIEVFESFSLSEQNTIEIGASIGGFLSPGICILFYGELGSGKTVFIRGICKALGIESKIVKSPTFTIVNEYQGVYPVAHADLYRLEGDLNAIKLLSLNEYSDEGYVLLVEWAENGDFHMDNIIKINIETDNDNMNKRRFIFSATGKNARYTLAEFAKTLQ
ncbi:MAG: tRNA (adenosine(37)-N6)-threonylcarbamoyltransferase complex ATPase subunit type 1 TsaE [Synergistaceae bacterium]|nr:tRNA (adenosine(37)-N6)-threonylcarbamoyltransferase complex ATPase subunit type 1 TsaE [Synergistaceae bacterium]